MNYPDQSGLAVVVIGRNEGARLIDCFRTIPNHFKIVYVDSGSNDGSVQAAREYADITIQLDAVKPFTAARARNEGAFAAVQAWPDIDYLQFIDGDCLLDFGWVPFALEFLAYHPNAAIVCGRRRERFPQRSIYNRLCDLEWDTTIGPVDACGGDAMIRVAPFIQVNGYCAELIAGEEPEMCARMRAAGWAIWRLDAEMTKHDAAMVRFSQWWRRAVRSGYAEFDIYRRSRRHQVTARAEQRQVLRSAFWVLVCPLLAIILGIVFSWKGLAALALYPFQITRTALRQGGLRPISWAYAIFVMIAKLAGAWGMTIYLWRQLTAKPTALIEYKEV